MEIKSCADIQREISLLVSEGGRFIAPGSVSRHIAACDPCARHLREMQELCGGLRSASARIPEVAITPGLRRRLMESFPEGKPAWLGIRSAWAALAPAAACLFLAFTLCQHPGVQKDFSAASGLAASVKEQDDSEEAFPTDQIVAVLDRQGLSDESVDAYPRRPSRSYLGTPEIM